VSGVVSGAWLLLILVVSVQIKSLYYYTTRQSYVRSHQGRAGKGMHVLTIIMKETGGVHLENISTGNENSTSMFVMRDLTAFGERSTPCPHVKHGDEWGEPSECDKGDNCSYCHTRTEQQFHPEIYKSTKCYDVLQTKSCPRGPFCAFAHREEEMKCAKDLPDEDDDLVAFSSLSAPKVE
jgi:hypothetical protein